MATPSKRKGGFTLVEMLIVVVVIAVLVRIAIPNFVRSGPSPANTCVNNLRQIGAAKQQWAIDHQITNMTTVPTTADIQPYWPRGSVPSCPLDKKRSFQTSYIINNLKSAPQCRFRGTDTNHVLIGH